MKKIIITFLFILSSLVSLSQTQFIFTPSEFRKFKVSSNAKCGQGSVYCMVTRSNMLNEYGNFVYQIYFSTNSYLPNCKPVSTYISDIEIYVFNGKWIKPNNYFKFWMIVGNTQLAYTLYHPNPLLPVRVSTGVLKPTTY